MDEAPKKRSLVKRPKSISIKMMKRSPINFIQYSFYKILRFLFVSVWFYYIPLIVVVISNLNPVLTNWQA